MFGGLFNFNKTKKPAEGWGESRRADSQEQAEHPEQVDEATNIIEQANGTIDAVGRAGEAIDAVERTDRVVDTVEQTDGAATFDNLSAVPFRGDQEKERPREELKITEFAERNPDDENLKALTDFLKTDLKIKTEMLAMAPRPEDDANESSRIEYVDGLDDGLKSMRLDFQKINRDFGFDNRATEDFFRARREGLAVGRYDAGVPQKLFRQEFSDMRPEFVDEVGRDSMGYSLFHTPMMGGALAGKARTVNELLHAYHSQIMNSDGILQKIPPIAQRELSHGYSVTLRGEPSPDAREILESIPNDMEIGWTDIVSAGGHIIMMVRDRGHALTLDITRGDKNYEVNYHIPKICNQKMVEALPGIGKVTPEWANGAFNISYEDKLGEVVSDFIARVPTDSDIEIL